MLLPGAIPRRVNWFNQISVASQSRSYDQISFCHNSAGRLPQPAGAEVTNDLPWHPSTRLPIFTQAERPLLFSGKILKQDRYPQDRSPSVCPYSRRCLARRHPAGGSQISPSMPPWTSASVLPVLMWLPSHRIHATHHKRNGSSRIGQVHFSTL